jgi:ATP-dependent helicase/DNAse subunit B
MMIDMSASSAIYEELKVIRNAGIDQTTDDIILNVLKLGVGGQSSSEGALHVTDISGAISSVRDNLYIVGLSASKFPGSPVENYLLLDDDLTIFGKDASYMTSSGKIAKKKDTLRNLVHLASGLGSQIFVSYAGMNVSELKRDNASSVIFELFREQSGKNVSSKELKEHIVKVGYFEPAISVSREVGNAYNQGKKVLIDKEASQSLENPHFVKWNLDIEYSPSALNTFFRCPRSFMLGYILGIPEPEDNKPFEIISAKANGTLAHSLMEQLANSDMSQEDFVKLSGEYFDRFIAQNPPLIMESVEAVRNQFLEMMETAYEMDPHREVILKEENIHFQHESGVKIHGLPDRVEKLDDGRYLIVDFKSGRRIGHVKDDIDTCLQVVIYAYLMEKQGLDIAGGVFRYIRLGESVSCVYDDTMKDKLNKKLSMFKEHMEKGYFPCTEAGEDAEDPCKFCKYGLVCGKN